MGFKSDLKIELVTSTILNIAQKSKMNMKISLIVCFLVVLVASGLDARRGGGFNGGRGGGRGGKGFKGIMFAKMLCRVFGNQETDDGTVKEYCESVKAEIKEFMEEKQNDLKDTIRAVCAAGNFGENSKEGRLCAKLDEETQEEYANKQMFLILILVM